MERQAGLDAEIEISPSWYSSPVGGVLMADNDRSAYTGHRFDCRTYETLDASDCACYEESE